MIKKADHACAFFEATQLAGFSAAESAQLFGAPPKSLNLTLEPWPVPAAQKRYLEHFDILLGLAEQRP